MKMLKANLLLSKYIWNVNKLYYILAIIKTIFDGIFPVFNAIILSLIINSIEKQSMDGMYFVLAMFMLMQLIQMLLFNVWTPIFNDNVVNNARMKFNLDFIKKVKDFEIDKYEHSENYDTISRAQQFVTNDSFDGFSNALSIIAGFVSMISFIVILATYNLWFVIIYFIMAVILVSLLGKKNKIFFDYENGIAQTKRKTWYLRRSLKKSSI